MWLYISLSTHAISIPFPLFRSFFSLAFFFLFFFFFFVFVCCLNANYSYIQFALKIGNLRSKQGVGVWCVCMCEWVSELLYLLFSFSSLHLKGENSLQIQRQSRTDFHYRLSLIVIQKCTYLYWAGFFLPWLLDVLLARLLAFLSFHFNFISFTNK